MILGIGVDNVAINEFGGQLGQPGSRLREVFTAREMRYARERTEKHLTGEALMADMAPSLAARWAAKEAFVKAWSTALFGQPPVAEENLWSQIEVINARWGRPAIRLIEPFDDVVRASVGDFRILVSLTHDADLATAFVVIEQTPTGSAPRGEGAMPTDLALAGDRDIPSERGLPNDSLTKEVRRHRRRRLLF